MNKPRPPDQALSHGQELIAGLPEAEQAPAFAFLQRDLDLRTQRQRRVNAAIGQQLLTNGRIALTQGYGLSEVTGMALLYGRSQGMDEDGIERLKSLLASPEQATPTNQAALNELFRCLDREGTLSDDELTQAAFEHGLTPQQSARVKAYAAEVSQAAAQGTAHIKYGEVERAGLEMLAGLLAGKPPAAGGSDSPQTPPLPDDLFAQVKANWPMGQAITRASITAVTQDLLASKYPQLVLHTAGVGMGIGEDLAALPMSANAKQIELDGPMYAQAEQTSASDAAVNASAELAESNIDATDASSAIGAEAVSGTSTTSGASESPAPSTPGLADSFVDGFSDSVVSLAIFGKESDRLTPEQRKALPALHRLARSLGLITGDLPAYGAGAVFGSPMGPVGATAGAFGLTAALRATYLNGIRNGEIKDLDGFLRHSLDVAGATATGVVEGASTTLGGMTGARTAARLGLEAGGKAAFGAAGEISALTTVSAALQGKFPSAQDFADNAALILALKGTGMGARALRGKLITITEKTGVHPRDVARLAKEDPSVLRDMRAARRCRNGFFKNWKRISSITTQ